MTGSITTPITPTTDIPAFVNNILTNDFAPILNLIGTFSYLIGLCLIVIGITRLHKHAGGMQQMMQRSSPTATAMYFVVGIIMISYMPYLQMLSSSVFGDATEKALFKTCASPVGGAFQTDTFTFCPMMAYTKHLSPTDNPSTGTAIKDMFFALMFLIGVISFIRGLMLLLHIGEGGGQGQGVGKAFTFIAAGIVGTNIDQFYDLMQNILTSSIGPS